MRSDLPVTELAENVYLLNEFDGTNCYLVVGSEKALLIDCGTGFCDIRGAAEKLTDLPITLAATHGHGDHIGGAGQFEEIYIHRADCERLNKAQMSLLFRKAFLASNAPVKSHGFKTSDVKPGKYKAKIIPMDDGHIFDLGGKSVRVKHTPGHSRGSACYRIGAQAFFSGDTIVPGCAVITRLRGGDAAVLGEQTVPFLRTLPPELTLYPGHGRCGMTLGEGLADIRW